MSSWPGRPCPLQLAPGDYAWCACGESATVPFCDQREGCAPVRFSLRSRRNVETQWLCACRLTKTAPFCDGSHNKKGR
jgi:CDGSH-type Zn-finger protein